MKGQTKTIKYPILYFLFFLCTYSYAQYLLNFKSLSRPEKRWVLFHPFVAKKAQVLTKKALQMVDSMRLDPRLDQLPNGGQIDAFRHTYWMALLSQKIHPRKVKKLGLAHEKANYIQFKKKKSEDGSRPDKISGDMDIFNNNIGIEIGTNNKTISEEKLRQLVFIYVKSGKCKIIKHDKANDFLTCNNQVINMNDYKHVWDIPKCIVDSNLVPE